MNEKNTKLFAFNYIWCRTIITGLFIACWNVSAQAQQINIGNSSGGGSSSGATQLNTVADWLIEQMLIVGASISTLFALGVVFAIKFGWMERSKIKDFVWLILAMIVLPTLIPAIFTFAQSTAGS